MPYIEVSNMNKIFTNIVTNNGRVLIVPGTVAVLLQQLIPWLKTRKYSHRPQIISHHALQNNKQTDDTKLAFIFLDTARNSVLHSGDVPQKHLNDFWGDACSLLVELFDLGSCFLLKALDICTRVTAAL